MRTHSIRIKQKRKNIGFEWLNIGLDRIVWIPRYIDKNKHRYGMDYTQSKAFMDQ